MKGGQGGAAVGPTTDPFTCPRCAGRFTATTRVPHLLFPCGCSICSACLKEVQTAAQGPARCPFDGEASQYTCVNQALVSQIRASCPQHPGLTFRYFCAKDDTLLCQDCYVFLHHDHGKPLSLEEGRERLVEGASKLMEGVDDRRQSLEEALRDVEARIEDVTRKSKSIECAVRAVAEEAVKAVEEARDKLLRENEDAKQEKITLLRTQAAALRKEAQALAGKVEGVKASLAKSTEISSVMEVITVLKEDMVADGQAQALEGLRLEPVVEDDVEYLGPGEAERKEALSKAMGKGGIWGRLKTYLSPMVQPVTSCGRLGPGDGCLYNPYHIAVDRERLYICDYGNSRILVLDKHRCQQVQVVDGGVGYTGKRLKNPTGIAVDDKCIYVAENNSHAVRAMDKRTGMVQWRVGTGKPGSGEGQFNSPRHCIVDSGHLYVADYSNRRICVLRKETGAPVRLIGTKCDLGTPEGMALDPEQPNLLYVSDYNGHRIQILDMEAEVCVKSFGIAGEQGSDNSHFSYPIDLAISNGLLYVSDLGNNRIQILDKKTGVAVATLERRFMPAGGSGSSRGGAPLFDKPNGLATDGRCLYVSEWGSHRIQVFST